MQLQFWRNCQEFRHLLEALRITPSNKSLVGRLLNEEDRAFAFRKPIRPNYAKGVIIIKVCNIFHTV